MKLQHVTPESVGVPSQAVLDLLDEFYRQGVEMHGLMLLRHGQVYAEGHWAPYNAQTPHILFSFSKSLTSTAIGFAVQEGILSLEERSWWTCSPTKCRRTPAKTCKPAACGIC